MSAERRLRIIWGALMLVGLVLIARYLQKAVFEQGTYKALANRQYLDERTVPAKRGAIYAHDQKQDTLGASADDLFPLALDTLKYSVWAVPKNVQDPPAASSKLKALFPALDEEKLKADLSSGKLYIPPLVRRIEKAVAEQAQGLGLQGIFVVPEHTRFYPEGAFAAHTLGFVNREGIGSYGLEERYDALLRGVAGSIRGEKDTRGRFISTLSSQASQDGSSLVLTVDRAIQFMVEQKLREAVEKFGAKGGSIVVLDPKTGGIKALASMPTFDPNRFNEVARENQSVFLNPAISSVYEPGSIMKAMVMAGALEAGKITPETEGTFSNMVVVDGYEIHTAEDKAFGKETMTQCLENSDNVCLVWIAEQLGTEPSFNNFKKFGFGEETGVDLSGEVGGTLPPLKNWRTIHRATTAFGQGISATPLQMAIAYAAIANGGKLMKPYLVEKILHSDGREETIAPTEVRQVVSQETAHKVTEMLVGVVERGHGKRAGVAGVRVAGKTGTAQIPNPAGGYYEDRHIGGFAGFFPADDPRFVMVIKLDEPQGVRFAESSAAPLFGEIAAWLGNYVGITSPAAPPPEP